MSDYGCKHTPTPWGWYIHDHSMASLGVLPDPGLGDPLVLVVAPCDACAGRANPKEWKWGRCHTPSEADAAFIVEAVNSHDAMKEFVSWVDSWVSNPVTSYSVHALDGLFGMTRDKIAALRAAVNQDDAGGGK